MVGLDVNWDVVEDCNRLLRELRDLLSRALITPTQHDTYKTKIMLLLKAEYDRVLP